LRDAWAEIDGECNSEMLVAGGGSTLIIIPSGGRWMETIDDDEIGCKTYFPQPLDTICILDVAAKQERNSGRENKFYSRGLLLTAPRSRFFH